MTLESINWIHLFKEARSAYSGYLKFVELTGMQDLEGVKAFLRSNGFENINTNLDIEVAFIQLEQSVK